MAEGKLQDTKVVANIFGLTEQRVGQLVKEGVITAAQKSPYRFDLLPTVKAYIAYLQERARGRNAPSEDAARLTEEKAAAEVRYKNAKAERAELELAELRGQMHRSEDVAAMTEDLIWAVRGLVLALPGRLAVDTASAQTAAEASEIIRKECCRALEELTRYEYDSEKYMERVRERAKMELEAGDGADEGERQKAKQGDKAGRRPRKAAGKPDGG